MKSAGDSSRQAEVISSCGWHGTGLPVAGMASWQHSSAGADSSRLQTCLGTSDEVDMESSGFTRTRTTAHADCLEMRTARASR